MAITDPTSGFNDGQPSSWSAAVDKISAEGKIISGGNVEEGELKTSGYPNACLNKSIEDPAQAWNALTVGAYSIDSTIQPRRETKGYSPVAQYGELSPYSSTSNEWKTQWPIKPEVVCDGGNVASDGTNFIQGMDELSKLTLSKDINRYSSRANGCISINETRNITCINCSLSSLDYSNDKPIWDP